MSLESTRSVEYWSTKRVIEYSCPSVIEIVICFIYLKTKRNQMQESFYWRSFDTTQPHHMSLCTCTVLYCTVGMHASTHWVLSSSSAATAETKGTKRLWWSSSRTIGSTASYRSLQMSPKMCAADAEIGWRRGQKCTFVHVLLKVYTPYYNNLSHRLTFTSGDLSIRLQSGV